MTKPNVSRNTGPTPIGPRSAAITRRDAAVLNWLAQVPIASTDTMHQAYAFFGGSPLTKQRLSQRLRILVAAGHLDSAVLQRGNNRRVYWPAQRPYPTARRDLAHDLLVARLSIMLLSAGAAKFLDYNRNLPDDIHAKEWTQDVPLDKNAHLADGLLWLHNDRTVIVEVELTPKSTRRLANILESHARRLRTDTDPAAHILYLTTRRVGQLVAGAWRQNGHAADHPEQMQIIHAVDDITLGTTPSVTTIPIPK